MNLAKSNPILWGLTLLLLAGCSTEVPVVEPALRPVRTELVEAPRDTVPATYAAVARAGVESRLSFRVSGLVEEVAVDLGTKVRRGQVLARLDPRDLELQVEQAEAGLAQSEASWRRSQADYDRSRALYENNNASKSDLDAARAAAESAEAQVNASRKQLQLASQQLGYAVLRAPQDGAIAHVDVEVNESVSAGQAVLLLSSGATPEVVVAVPEVVIAQVSPGQEVSVTFDSLPGTTFKGKVTEVAVATSGSSAFEVVASLNGASTQVRSGLAADVTFRFPSPTGGGFFLQPVAVGEDDQGTYVFVLEAGEGGTGLVRRRSVEVGELTGNGLQVRSGLETGERVVTAGVRRLSDGMKVKVSE